jgi:hypothetical protein
VPSWRRCRRDVSTRFPRVFLELNSPPPGGLTPCKANRA